jgi:signal peptidase I
MKIIEYFKKRKEEKIKKKLAESKTKRIIKSLIWTVLYISFIFGLIWFLPRGLSYALKTDYPMAAITSGSMWPVLKRGDLIFVQGIEKSEINEGDIVVYTNEKNAFTIHRIIELREDTLVTKGDANNVSDKPVKYEDIVGRLYKIGERNARVPKLGLISTFASKYNKNN